MFDKIKNYIVNLFQKKHTFIFHMKSGVSLKFVVKSFSCETNNNNELVSYTMKFDGDKKAWYIRIEDVSAIIKG